MKVGHQQGNFERGHRLLLNLLRFFN